MSNNYHFTAGIDTGGRHGDLSCYANHVHLPLGQYEHVINLPQYILSFASSLPPQPSELDAIVVRKEGANQSHHDFRVRIAAVHHALQWLLANNSYVYYHADQISHKVFVTPTLCVDSLTCILICTLLNHLTY